MLDGHRDACLLLRSLFMLHFLLWSVWICVQFLWLVNVNEILVGHMTWCARGSTWTSIVKMVRAFWRTSFQIFCTAQTATVSILLLLLLLWWMFLIRKNAKWDHPTLVARTKRMKTDNTYCSDYTVNVWKFNNSSVVFSGVHVLF